MSESSSGPSVVKSALLAMWAMATLILFFCVALLVYQMTQQGMSPLNFDPEQAIAARNNESVTEPARAQEVRLYFADNRGMGIVPESRRVEFTESTVDNCKSALEALIEGPRADLLPTVPPESQIRGIFLLANGELVVDFSPEFRIGMTTSTSTEMLMMQSIVTTLTQPRLRGSVDMPVRTVRFLFDGSAPQDIFPAHIDLSEPVAFNDGWTSQSGEGPGDA